jgi:hypothetical protein
MAASDRVSDAAVSLLRLGSRPAALPQAQLSSGLLKRTSSLIRINAFRRASGKIHTIDS